MTRQDATGSALAAFTAKYRDLIALRGTNFTQLAAAAGFSQTYVSRAAKGHAVPSEPLVVELDRVLNAGGELLRLRDEADRERTARRRRTTPAADTGQTEEVGAADRRTFVELGALSALALATQQRIDTGDPDSVTLDELESDVDDIARAYGSAPHTELLPTVADRWRLLGTILDGHVSLAVRPRVLELRGQFTYFLGRLAFNADDMRSARRFASLAGRYAGEVGEPVLILSVAALRSSIAYWTGRHGAALAALAEVEHLTHPYIDARTAAYRARAYTSIGDHAAARTWLDRMETTAGTFAPMPGSTPVGPAGVAMFRAGSALGAGDVDQAREWAPLAVAGYRARGGDYSTEEAQHALLNVALTHVAGRRDQQEPEEAARLARTVLTATRAAPTHTVAAKVRRVGQAFGPEHQHLPEVSAFTEACRALPAGTGTR